MRISMAARKYICLVSRMSGDEIVHIAIPFIRENILEIGSWRHREAAISAYESILDGSTINKLSPHVTGLLRFLLPTIKDENNVPETVSLVLSLFYDDKKPDGCYRLASYETISISDGRVSEASKGYRFGQHSLSLTAAESYRKTNCLKEEVSYRIDAFGAGEFKF